MSDPQFGDQSGEQARKRSVPTWVWFVGGGCLLAVVLSIVAAVVGWRFFNAGRDPEQQWPKLARILPFDEQPPGLSLEWGSSWPMEIYVMHDGQGLIATVMRFRGGDAASARDQLLDEQSEGGFMGAGGRQDMQKAQVQVQGRQLEVLRFYQQGGLGGENEAAKQSGQSAVLDLTEDGSSGLTVLQLIRASGGEAISDDEIRAFLQPFHVGPDRR